MCGIVATMGHASSASQIRSMTAAQRRRGPDGDGVWLRPDGQAGLGHRRLSIIDLSSDGRQPMANGPGDRRIVFNGEIYNYLELRAELSGYAFRTQTDTEVILAAYERWGIDCIERFIGMFAFVLVDDREDRVYAVRDRFGVKPLYFAESDETIYIASEITALQAIGLGCEPDPVAWATYFQTGLHDHSARTFWRGVNRCSPVGCWSAAAERARCDAGTTWPLESASSLMSAVRRSSPRSTASCCMKRCGSGSAATCP